MSSSPGHSFDLNPRQKLEILGAILLALFLFALDQTVVGTALPIISTDLNGADRGACEVRRAVRGGGLGGQTPYERLRQKTGAAV